MDKEEKANTKRQIHEYKVKYKDKDNVLYLSSPLYPEYGHWAGGCQQFWLGLIKADDDHDDFFLENS